MVMTRSDMEARRLEAAALLRAGKLRQSKVAREFGVSRTSVSRWAARLDAGDTLKARKGTGRPGRVSREALRTLWDGLAPAIAEQAAPTARQFGDAIFATTGVRYHEDHVYRLILKLPLRARKNRVYRRQS